jgi:hypothetical protein
LIGFIAGFFPIKTQKQTQTQKHSPKNKRSFCGFILWKNKKKAKNKAQKKSPPQALLLKFLV